MSTAGTAVWYTPGPWLAVVGPACVVAVDAPVDTPLFVAWAEATAAGAGTDELLLIAGGHPGVASFAVLEPRADGLRVVLRGGARVWCADGQELGAAGAEPWRDGVVGPTALPARVGGAVPGVGPRLPLTLGAVFCAVLDLYPAPAPVAPATPSASPTPAPDPLPLVPQPLVPQPASSPWLPPAATRDEAMTAPTTPVSRAWAEAAVDESDTAGPPPVYDPRDVTVARSSLPVSGPTVVAVRCPAGHLTPAHAQVCRVCDLPIGTDQEPVTVARPDLGVLRLPSGQAITLDRGVVFGRAPSARDTTPGEQQHVVSVASPQKDVSRNHLEIVLDGWHVLAVDLGSVNGSVVTLPGREPQRLRPDEPFLLERGATVSLADEVTVTFEIPA